VDGPKGIAETRKKENPETALKKKKRLTERPVKVHESSLPEGRGTSGKKEFGGGRKKIKNSKWGEKKRTE